MLFSSRAIIGIDPLAGMGKLKKKLHTGIENFTCQRKIKLTKLKTRTIKKDDFDPFEA